jgi:glutathione S-transferase/RNA polymerase-associated protein
MLTLYEHPSSAYAMKAKIALMEKGLEFHAEIPQGLGTDTPGGGFGNASPRVEVPALVDGDVKVFDSTIILEYLEDKWPEPPLLPKSPAERARVRMIEDVMDGLYEPNNWGLFEVTRFKRVTGPLADTLVGHAKRSIERLQGWLEQQLGNSQWMNGDAFGWGDIACAPHVNRTSAFGYAPAAGSKLAAWLTRVNQRKSVATVIEQMHRQIANMPDMAGLLASGKVKRQYRDHRLEWMIAAGGLSVVKEGLEKDNIRFTRLPG